MFSKFLDDLNFISRCKKYNLGLWQCPNFLFLAMGFITVAAMFGTFYVSQQFASETVSIMSVTLVTVFIMTLGSFVIRGVEKVAEANILKTEFISIISHQLCSPLSAIRWNLEILETEKNPDRELTDKQMVFLNNIKNANEQMLKMVTDLLDVARIEQGLAVFEKTKVKITDLAREALADFQFFADEKKIQMDLSASPDLPDVLVDRKRLRVVIDNLISNALKYSREDSKIKVGIEGMNKEIIFSVQDWGVGIPRFQHNKIFEKFFRSSNESHYRTEGVGIGLYLAREILKNLGGRVWFESEAGKGSTFYFSLPAA